MAMGQMNRRNFLGLIGATASGLVLPDPRRVYSFPSEWWLKSLEQRRVIPGVTFTVRLSPFTETIESIERKLAELPDALGPGGLAQVRCAIERALLRHEALIGQSFRSVLISGKVVV
jgi:hypothetical protein